MTVHGKAVARMVAVDDRMAVADEARQTLLARLTSQKATKAAKWARESLCAEPT